MHLVKLVNCVSLQGDDQLKESWAIVVKLTTSSISVIKYASHKMDDSVKMCMMTIYGNLLNCMCKTYMVKKCRSNELIISVYIIALTLVINGLKSHTHTHTIMRSFHCDIDSVVLLSHIKLWNEQKGNKVQKRRTVIHPHEKQP